MGGAILTIEGDSEKEVRLKVERALEQARFMGLFEDRRSTIEFYGAKGKWVVCLAVHT